MNKLFTIVFALFCSVTLVAQTVVTGTITDSKSNQPIPGVNVRIEGKFIGTSSDFDGNFTLKITETPPFKVVFTSIGYESQTIEVTENNQKLSVSLAEGTQLDEVVVSASRTPESVRESPVTIERMDIRDIKTATAPSFYDGLENLKGVQLNTGSLTFKSVNTRGFATFSNERFVQLVDGMDNSSPALNFVMGNLVGMSELDVASVELLPGASSALYGANAFNGILFMTSKNPFEHQGASAYAKTGITSQKAAGDNSFADVGVRFAHAFSEKFAAKVSFSYLKGTEWWATNTNNIKNGILESTGSRTDPGYDGLNISGDGLVRTNMVAVAQQLVTGGQIPAASLAVVPSIDVSRTGYAETDLFDGKAESVKVDAALHYRPNADDLEIIYNGKLGTGNSIYQGANRYQLKNFFLQQHKLEVRNDDFFARVYATSESAGDTYDMEFTAINLNRRWKPDNLWFGQYVGTYVQAFTGQIPNIPAGNATVAHATARTVADTGRLQPGTAAFNTAFNQITADPDVRTGSKFQDNTRVIHAEGNYNFKRLLNDWADLQVGGSWREFKLNSMGTIFTDADAPIFFKEYAAYTQLSKKLLDDRLKLTGSLRYDKGQNFDGRVSPRISAVASLGERRQHNFRASFQTGFRNPTTQDQYIGLNAGAIILLGSAQDNLNDYSFTKGNGTIDGNKVYKDSYTIPSARAFGTAVQAAIAGGATTQQAIGANIGTLQRVETSIVKPEEITAYEVGYRGEIVKGASLDLSVYYNDYSNFISQNRVLTPLLGTTTNATGALDVLTSNTQAYNVYTNAKDDINSYGLSLGLNVKLFKKFKLGLNYDYNKFEVKGTNPDLRQSFNTPENRVKVSFESSNLFENLGFKVNARWFDAYKWEAAFADGLVPSATILDAQLSYSVPKIKSTFKIGGSNILNKEYSMAIGPGLLGAQYYVSWTAGL